LEASEAVEDIEEKGIAFIIGGEYDENVRG